MSGDNLLGAILDGAILEGTILDGAVLDGAQYDIYTAFPSGFKKDLYGLIFVNRDRVDNFAGIPEPLTILGSLAAALGIGFARKKLSTSKHN